MSTFGSQLRERRENLGLSVRAAAGKAGFSEALWRQYEAGYRAVIKDVTVPVTPSDKNVRAAARVVGWDVADALDAAGLSQAAAAVREGTASRVLSVVPETIDPVEDDDDNEVLTAIRADPDLDEIAREHFLNQYMILRGFSRMRREAEGAVQRLPYASQDRPSGPVDPEEEERIERAAREAALANPHSPVHKNPPSTSPAPYVTHTRGKKPPSPEGDK